MNPRIAEGVTEAEKDFHTFLILQMMGAWLADAPDPDLLIEELLSKWESRMRTRYAKAARKQAEATGVIVTGGDWLEEVIAETTKRLRISLAKLVENESRTETGSIN